MANRGNRAAPTPSSTGHRANLSWMFGGAGGGGGAGQGSVIPNPNYDPNFKDTGDGSYAFTKQGYDPKINYTNPVLDNRTFLQKMIGQPNTARALNNSILGGVAQQSAMAPGMTAQAVAQQQALAPGALGQLRSEQDILNQAILAREKLLSGEKEEGMGKSLVDLAQGGQIPYSALPGGGGNYQNIGKAFFTGYGNRPDVGAIRGIPETNLAAQQASYGSSVLSARSPFASAYGNALGQSDVSGAQLANTQNQVGMQYAQPDAAARLGELQGRALTAGVTPGGFNLANGTILQGPRQEVNTVPRYYPNPKAGAPPIYQGLFPQTTFTPGMQYKLNATPSPMSAQQVQEALGQQASEAPQAVSPPRQSTIISQPESEQFPQYPVREEDKQPAVPLSKLLGMPLTQGGNLLPAKPQTDEQKQKAKDAKDLANAIQKLQLLLKQ